jgi:stalled ribosome alternative rescue factor ArfA
MAQKARNAVARDLHSRKYAIRIVAKAKGKGSYRRNEKHRLEARSGASSILGRRFRNEAKIRRESFDRPEPRTYSPSNANPTEVSEMRVRPTRRSFLPVERMLVAAAFVFVVGAILQYAPLMQSAAALAVAAVVFGGARGAVSAMRGYLAVAGSARARTSERPAASGR